MVSFRKKKITAIESLGEKLARHRQALGRSLDRAATATKVAPRYLKMLEADDYEAMLPDVYMINFLRQYAKYLNLNPNSVVNHFEKERQLYQKTRAEKPKIRWQESRFFITRFFNWLLRPLTLKYLLGLFAFVLVLFYIGFSIKQIFSPPELIIKSPDQASTITTERVVKIEGVTEREAELTINDRQVLPDNEGRFSLEADLQKGLNIIKITAKKKHSKSQIVYRQVIVEDEVINPASN